MHLFHTVFYNTNLYQVIYLKIVPTIVYKFTIFAFWDPKNVILLFKMCIFTKLFIKNFFNFVNYWNVLLEQFLNK